MKQTKLSGYRPKYPKKAMRGAALAAAALMAMGTATGCSTFAANTTGIVPVADPTPEELVLDGEVAVWEPTDDVELEGYMVPETPTSEPMLVGIVMPEPTPDPLELRTEGMVPVETPIEKPPVVIIPEVPETDGAGNGQ